MDRDEFYNIGVKKRNNQITQSWDLLNIECGKPFKNGDSFARWMRKQVKNKDSNIQVTTDKNAVNYKETIEIHSDGKQTSDKLIEMSNEQSKDVEFLLKSHGFSPVEWQLVSARNNIWNNYSKQDGIQVLYSSKITVKPKENPFDINWVKETFNDLKDDYHFPTVKNNFINLTTDKMLEINLADVHLNKLAFVDETGSEYNYKIAEERLIQVIHDIIEKTKHYKFEKILLPVGQDFFNIDSPNGTTKGTRQDTSQRYPQMFKLGLKVFSYIIDYLSKIAPVEAFYVGGNHDKILSFCLIMSLSERYYKNENVKVDVSERIRKYHLFGINCIGFAHGDEEKSRLGKLMPIEVPDMWAKSKFREMHCSHLHKEMLVDEQNGLILRRVSSISGTDAWSYESGYIGSVKKAQAFVYDKHKGLEMIINSTID